MSLGDNIKPHINAEWAKEESNKVLSDKVTKQLNECLNSVELALKRDDDSASVTIYAHEKVKQILRNRGFKVNQFDGFDQRDPAYITIEW